VRQAGNEQAERSSIESPGRAPRSDRKNPAERRALPGDPCGRSAVRVRSVFVHGQNRSIFYSQDLRGNLRCSRSNFLLGLSITYSRCLRFAAGCARINAETAC
jgi:hypothetical protein